MINRITAAGWVQESGAEGFRCVHPELGETRWYKTPFLAMDEADSISAPAQWDTGAEGY